MSRRQAPWQRDPVILERLRVVERLHLRGCTNVAIAKECQVDEKTIRNDLERIGGLWQDVVKDDITSLRAAVIAELDSERLLALDYADFDRRMEEAVMTGGSFVRDDGTEHEIHLDKDGRAQFRGAKGQSLNVARQATMDKAKVLGVVVDKATLTDADGNDLASLILKARADGNSNN